MRVKKKILGLISNTDYFRIMKAIAEALNEDLQYLANIVINMDILKEIHKCWI